MDKKICRLSITYQIECDGLIGGDYEYDPYVEFHGSFGPYRVQERDSLIEVKQDAKIRPLDTNTNKEEGGEILMKSDYPTYRSSKTLEIELLDYDKMKGDDSLNFKLFSHTRYSGVDSIDKSESQYVQRQVSSGICKLDLLDLFKYYLSMCETSGIKQLNQATPPVFSVSDRFIDQKIIEEKVQALVKSQRQGKMPNFESELEKLFRAAKSLTHKAQITFDVTVHHFNHALYKKSIFGVPDLRETGFRSMLPLNSRTKHTSTGMKQMGVVYSQNGRKANEFEPLLFNSEKVWKMMINTVNDFLGLYCKHFIANEQTGDCLYAPSEPVIGNLQLPLYIGEQGRMAVYGYWANHDPFYREYASEEAREADLKLYGFNQKSEDYFLMMLRSSLRRHGQTEATFITAINEHFSPNNLSRDLSPHLVVAEEVVADVGTYVANSAYYTADTRFMNNLESLDENGHQHKNLGELRRCVKCGKKCTVKVLSLDSWDNNILNNTSMCDDCEGQDNTATTVIRSLAIGRYDLQFKWKNRLMQAAQKLLEHSAVVDVGALVTSAFMDTNNKKIESRQEELPLIGSELDKNAQNDGHCHGLMPSLRRAIEMYEAGNGNPQVVSNMKKANRLGGDADQEAEETYKIRDTKRTLLVLEPTGSIEPRALSITESYTDKTLRERKIAEFRFLKHMRLRLKESEKESGISEMFVGEGLSHYEESQDPRRRISPFYNSVVHGSSVDLMKRFDPSLSQFAFCKNVSGDTCYGVRMGELIRGDKEAKLSLICPYSNYGEKWRSTVIPMNETIENQMPIARFGRYTDEEYATQLYSRYIAPKEMSASFDFSFGKPSSKQSLEAQREFEKLLAEVEKPNSNKSVVRLYSRVWKLTQDKSKTERLNKFIQEMPGLLSYAFYVEKHMVICEPVIDILCIIDVKKSFTLTITAAPEKK